MTTLDDFISLLEKARRAHGNLEIDKGNPFTVAYRMEEDDRIILMQAELRIEQDDK